MAAPAEEAGSNEPEAGSALIIVVGADGSGSKLGAPIAFAGRPPEINGIGPEDAEETRGGGCISSSSSSEVEIAHSTVFDDRSEIKTARLFLRFSSSRAEPRRRQKESLMGSPSA